MRSTLFLAFLTFACAEVFAGPDNDHRRHHSRASKAEVAAAAKLNTPAAGSAPTEDFKASASLPVAKLAAAAKQAKKAGAKYQISQGSKTWSTIFTDWANFKSVSTHLLITYKILMSTHSLLQGSAYVWTADMDIDCDGIDFQCKVGTPLTAIIPSPNPDP
jgi:chitosanase